MGGGRIHPDGEGHRRRGGIVRPRYAAFVPDSVGGDREVLKTVVEIVGSVHVYI
jgi:hypothetical protein